MTTAQIGGTIRKMFDRVRGPADHGDGELLARYRAGRDQEAFGSLVRRHGPMVLGVCRRVLRDAHAADDAFQAVFLVLARKADAVRPPDRLAPWLYGVAYRTALKARGRAFRRAEAERQFAEHVGRELHDSRLSGDASELLAVIDEQVNALPEKYRTPLVLCGLQGLNKAEAAERLGLPEGTVSSRLARAREMLRDRLTRRGIVVPAVAFASLLTAESLQAAVPVALAETAAATAFGSGIIPATVLTLSHEVIRSMTLLKLKFLGAIAVTASLVSGGYGLVTLQADDKKPQPVPGEVKKPKPVDPVNNQKLKAEVELLKQELLKLGSSWIICKIDTKSRTITAGYEDIFPFKVDASGKIYIDNKLAELTAVKPGMFVFVHIHEMPTSSDVRVTGPTVKGSVTKSDAAGITVDASRQGDPRPWVLNVTSDTEVTLDGKKAKASDLTAGDEVSVVVTTDGSAALTITRKAKPDDKPKPDAQKPAKPDGEKPAKPARVGGKVLGIDATARTLTLSGKVEGKETVVTLTAEAKVTIDGKDAKVADIPKGALASVTLTGPKAREANEVTVTGPTIQGTIKKVDDTSITIGGEKADRVIKLAANGKVAGAKNKDAKLTDLKVGDEVTITLTADESGAILIAVGGKKPGTKVKPGSEDEEDE